MTGTSHQAWFKEMFYFVQYPHILEDGLVCWGNTFLGYHSEPLDGGNSQITP
jgi:hypothetical protein